MKYGLGGNRFLRHCPDTLPGSLANADTGLRGLGASHVVERLLGPTWRAWMDSIPALTFTALVMLRLSFPLCGMEQLDNTLPTEHSESLIFCYFSRYFLPWDKGATANLAMQMKICEYTLCGLLMRPVNLGQ